MDFMKRGAFAPVAPLPLDPVTGLLKFYRYTPLLA